MVKIIMLAVLFCVIAVFAQPGPGEIFKEFVYDPSPGYQFDELDPDAKYDFSDEPGFANRPRRVPRKLNLDLADAIRAEVSVEYWGGHSGTAEQKFRANDHDWIMVPQPHNTPTAPQCYYRTMLGNESVPIPLSHLKHGANEFQFTCGGQICHNFNWGFYWIYSFTVRVYYKPSRPHPVGRMLSPLAGSTITDDCELLISLSGPSAIRQVDYIGTYTDFDWDGNGLFEQWQYQTQYGVLRRHMASSSCAPFDAVWRSSGIPDQDKPVKIMAKITDITGMCYTTPAVENITFLRANRSLKMYTSYDVPECFGVRVGSMMTCKIAVADDLGKARSARLVLSTWSAAHADAIGLNDKKLAKLVGCVHNYSFDSIPVPVQLIKNGVNTFFIYAETDEHAAEVNWPGPVLLVEYAK